MGEARREFLLYSRKGPTVGFSYQEGLERRMDLVARAVMAAIFLSHRLRDAEMHISLNGPPRPPVLVSFSGDIRNVSPNEKSIMGWMAKVLSGKTNPGISVERKPFQEFVREKAAEGKEIYVLHEKGTDISSARPRNPLFIIGDHIGLPEKEERFALRYGEKISIGPLPYLASSVISFLNVWMDRIEWSMDQ